MTVKKRGGQYDLMSTSKPGKVLKHFGGKKPSEAAVAKEEKRVEYFKRGGKDAAHGGAAKSKFHK